MKTITKMRLPGYIMVFIALVILMLIFINSRCSDGVIVLEDFEHGVAFCGSEIKWVAHSTGDHAWQEGRATYVVNKGHLHDPEVKELKELAEKVCKKYAE